MTYLKIYNKDEKHKPIMFIIDIGSQSQLLKQIKEAIKFVWTKDEYNQDDLRDELRKFGRHISIVYDSEVNKEVELAF